MSLSVHISSNKDRSERGSYYSVSDYGDVNEKSEYDAEKHPGITHTTSTSTYKSISHDDHRHHKFFKPNSNRTWALVAFLAAIGLCILLLELAIHTYPDSHSIPKLQARNVFVERRAIVWKRQENGTTSAEIFIATLPIKPTPGSTTISTVESSPDVDDNEAARTTTVFPGQPPPDKQITITTDSPTIAPNPADQVTITTKPPVVVAPNPESQVSITTKPPTVDPNPDPVSSPKPDDQLSVTSPPTQPRPDDQVTITSEEGITVGQPPPESQVSITTGTDYATGSVFTVASVASVVSGSLLVSGTDVIGTVQQGTTQDMSAAGIGLVTLTNSAGVPTGTLAYTGLVVATDASGRTTTVSYNGAVVLTDSSGKATRTVSLTGKATQAAAVDNNSDGAGPFTQWSYFLAMYLPNIIGVILQSSWLVVFATFKMMEPFYQLASPGGGFAHSTLTADYLSTGLSSSVFKTAAGGHWIMVLAGQVQFGLAMILMFVSEGMNVVPTAYCETEISKKQPCDPKWVVHTSMVRVVEVLLVGCFSMIVMIVVLNRKRVSGVYSDPSRIATMADLLVHRPLIQELRDLPAMANKGQIAHDLAESRYVLGTFIDQGQEQYGIIKIDVCNDRSDMFRKGSFYRSAFRRISTLSDGATEVVHKAVPFLPDFLCMALAVILFTIILAYYLIDGRDTSNTFNAWMSSDHIGPNILLSGLAVAMGFLVKRKERYFRLSHPYVVLSKGPALASETITAGTSYTPFTSVYRALRNQDFSLSLLSLAAIFSDIILILTPGVPFTSAQTRPVYISSTFVVTGLTAFIFIIVARVTFKEWNRGNRYHECPETLAAVLVRLCASRFVEEKNATNHRSERDVFDGDDDESQRLRYEGSDGTRRYTYGVLEGSDGVYRRMVEENLHASKMIHPAFR